MIEKLLNLFWKLQNARYILVTYCLSYITTKIYINKLHSQSQAIIALSKIRHEVCIGHLFIHHLLPHHLRE